jgi:hypothetical protein
MSVETYQQNERFCREQAAMKSGPDREAWLRMAEQWASLLRGLQMRGGPFGPGIDPHQQLQQQQQQQQQVQPKPKDEK